MLPSKAIKSISYLKAHASELVRNISDNQKTMIITQNGEAKVVVQDIKVYEQTQESLAFLKLLALNNKNLKEGNVKPLKQAFADIRKKVEESNEK